MTQRDPMNTVRLLHRCFALSNLYWVVWPARYLAMLGIKR